MRKACAQIFSDQEIGFGEFENEKSQIIPEDFFEQVEIKYKETLYQENNLTEGDIEHMRMIHKMLFDSLNENLQQLRIYGRHGRPFSYSLANRREGLITPDLCAEILERCRNDVIENLEIKAGLLKSRL